jgi:hypothetical protein
VELILLCPTKWSFFWTFFIRWERNCYMEWIKWCHTSSPKKLSGAIQKVYLLLRLCKHKLLLIFLIYFSNTLF